MFKNYLFLIIFVCVVQQRICKPLIQYEYNDKYEIATKTIDLHVPVDTEAGYLIRRYNC